MMNLDDGNGGLLSLKTSSTSEEELYSVSASDVLRLIQAHLMECGLHQTVRTLQRESGIGLAASSLHTTWKQLAVTGQWAAVLQGLAILDKDRISATSVGEPSSIAAESTGVVPLLASVHEMAILELAEIGEWETAYAAFRFLQTDESLLGIRSELSVPTGTSNKDATTGFSVGRSLEQKLAALAAARQRNDRCALPDDYYGIFASTGETTVPQTKPIVEIQKHSRRSELGQRLQDIIPKQPPQRLLTLLQQAIKWQSYTGQLPHIRRRYQENDEATQKTKRRKTVIFDMVLGQVSVDSTTVGKERIRETVDAKSKSVSRDYAKIKFGKNVVCMSAAFLSDGSGVVTGSTDGFIEFWSLDGELRTDDLPFQKNEEVICHEFGASISALAVSNDTTMLASGASDGTVNIWKIKSGECLRSLQTTTSSQGMKAGRCSSISFLSFAPDSSRVLVAHDDGTCREFGLRTARMLKEFSGHTSYITSCSYEIIHRLAGQSGKSKVDMEPSGRGRDDRQLVVITSSGDGTVRLWDGMTADLLFIFRPISVGLQSNLSPVATSIRVMDLTVSDQVASSGSPAIQTVLKLHTPAHTFILVPRGQRAFLINYHGLIQQIFQGESQDSKVKPSMFVAATVSATNRWLYAVQENGACCVFDVSTGKLDRTIADFGSNCTSVTPSEGLEIEVTNLIHHPSRDVVGAFSSDKRQRKGKLVLWK